MIVGNPLFAIDGLATFKTPHFIMSLHPCRPSFSVLWFCCVSPHVRFAPAAGPQQTFVPSLKSALKATESTVVLKQISSKRAGYANSTAQIDLTHHSAKTVNQAQCHRMSLWLSAPTTAPPNFPASIIQGFSLPSNSATFIFFWTFFITFVVILLLAIRSSYRSSKNIHDNEYANLKLRLPRSASARWEDEEKAALMEDGYIVIRI